MKKVIYLIRHSSPFVAITNYKDYRNINWTEFNRNMILSSVGEEKASKLCDIGELKGIKDVYASNSARAIGTSKYLAEMNNTEIKLDDRINEREFDVERISQLPEDFNNKSFRDKNFKYQNGESLNDVDKRFNDFINELLNSNIQKAIVVLHGIILLSFLENNCDFSLDGNKIYVKYNGKIIVDEKPKSPGVYKITYEDNKIVDIDCVN